RAGGARVVGARDAVEAREAGPGPGSGERWHDGLTPGGIVPMRIRVALASLTMVVALVPAAVNTTAAHAVTTSTVPRFSHVIEIFLENESATSTWEDPVAAPNLARLRGANAYVPDFFGAGHASLGNYEAAFGAVEPTSQGKSDCIGQPYG